MRRTDATNTTATYGWVERAFHWSIAVLIVTAIVLGLVANDLPFDTDAALARKAFVFSFHKTVGVTIFFVALLRIGWAASQPRPRPLHGGWEAALASVVHWLLYGSLVAVPLLGWSGHAASQGFAPIWWPLGQSLPLVPKSPGLAAVLETLHVVFGKVLIGALILHVLGTAKHLILDRDLTLARMWRGADPGPLAAARVRLLPALVAAAVWGAALVVGLALNPEETIASTGRANVAGGSNWTVEDGTLAITVTQMGSGVTGRFADWRAAIDFDEAAGEDGTNGSVEVSVATGSLTLGSVTAQATGEAFLASEAFPTATFAGDIRPDGEEYVAEGALTLRGVEVPLRLPFTLDLDGDTAEMTGQVVLDRRDYEIGETYPDETSVGFDVTVDVALTARRAR